MQEHDPEPQDRDQCLVYEHPGERDASEGSWGLDHWDLKELQSWYQERIRGYRRLHCRNPKQIQSCILPLQTKEVKMDHSLQFDSSTDNRTSLVYWRVSQEANIRLQAWRYGTLAQGKRHETFGPLQDTVRVCLHHMSLGYSDTSYFSICLWVLLPLLGKPVTTNHFRFTL